MLQSSLSPSSTSIDTVFPFAFIIRFWSGFQSSNAYSFIREISIFRSGRLEVFCENFANSQENTCVGVCCRSFSKFFEIFVKNICGYFWLFLCQKKREFVLGHHGFLRMRLFVLSFIPLVFWCFLTFSGGIEMGHWREKG